MNARDDAALVDLERIAITARSVLDNLEVLTKEGLSVDGVRQARDEAERLVNAGSHGTAGVRRRAVSLRGVLAEPSGPTSDLLRAWLDDALTPAG